MDCKETFFNTANYELTRRKLGEGSIGSVYLAINQENNQEYAAKIIDISDGFDGNQQMIFLRESLLLHKLNHPSIVKSKGINFQSFTDPSKLQPTIITEYLPHGSLRYNINKEYHFVTDLNWNPTKKYIMLLGISDAMRYLHQNGIVHRDLKPENILVDENYHPLVSDYGLSRCFPTKFIQSIKLTMTGEIGSLMYMAPELLRRENKYDFSVDVYSFGILAYEIVTGKKPFSDLSSFEYVHKILSGERPTIPNNINDTMKDLIMKCWHEDPQERPSFEEIFSILSENYSYSNEKTDENEIRNYLLNLEEASRIAIEKEFNNDSNDSNRNTFNQYNKSLKKEKKTLNFVIFILISFIILCVLETLFFVDFKRKYDAMYQYPINHLLIGLDILLDNKKDRNFLNAMYHFQKSSEEGNSYSSYILGLLYEFGEGIEQNFNKAIFYYTKSADQGNTEGINRIGLCYLNETNKNDAIAIEFFEKAEKLKNSNAINNLGLCYSNGIGVRRNYSIALKYYQKAAKLGNSEALFNLGSCYEKGEGVRLNYTKAIEYYEEAANLGNYKAMLNLGSCYKDGKGVHENITKATEYFEKARKLGVKR